MKQVFVFPGQGSQYVGMGKSLYDNFKYVKELFELASDTLKKDFKKLCFESDINELSLTQNTQPAILLHSKCALDVLEKELGIYPKQDSIVLGHSLGEYSALISAKVIPFVSAIKIVQKRADLMASIDVDGGMAAVIGISESELTETCLNIERETSLNVSIANYNSDTQYVVAFENKAFEILNKKLQDKKAKVIKLNVSKPFHSSYMEKIAPTFKIELLKYNFAKLESSYIANVDAKLYNLDTNENVIKNNLVTQLYSPVRWKQSIDLIGKLGVDFIIELGPLKVLFNLIKRSLKDIKMVNLDTTDDLKNIKSVLNV